MTDRELLELAAKAAGIKFVSMDNWPHQDGCRFWRDGDCCDCGAAWNPLTDDGDALRLAVKLNMFIDVTREATGAQIVDLSFCSELHNNTPYPDPYAATRRAIVRAAAELGKAMK